MAILEPKGHTRAGGLRLNASRIALRELDRHPFAGIFVESTMHAVGMDPDRLPLRNFLDHNDHFVVLFEDPALAYLFGTLYRDNAFDRRRRDLASAYQGECGVGACDQ